MNSDRAALMKTLYGVDVPVSKAKKEEKVSGGDKFLVATNAASAGLGAMTMPALVKDVKSKMPKSAGSGPKSPVKSAKTAARARKIVMNPVGRKAARGVTALKKPKYALPAAGVALGGAMFNAGTDAASAVSLSRPKKKVEKADTPQQKIKLKALEATETVVRQKAPAAGKAVKAGAKAANDTWKMEAKVSKALEDKKQVYGWASITELNGEPVVDMQGDYVTIEEIEKAAHAYISKSRKGGDMHVRDGDGPKHVADLIESIVVTPEKKEALGMPADSPTGWFVGFQVHDDATWDLVKDGKRPMFSIHGSGRRVERELEDAGVSKAAIPVPAHALKPIKQAVKGVKAGAKSGKVSRGATPKAYQRGTSAGAGIRRNRVAIAAGAGSAAAAGGAAAYVKQPERRSGYTFNPYER